MPAISVIVPTRLRNHLLPRALRSLFVQSFADFEIIVVDDNPADKRLSRDASLREVLSESRIRVIEHDQPRNAASARNCGLRLAKGKFITYLDDDDAYGPEKLEKQWTWAQETGLPLGLCGLINNLSGRRRLRQVAASFFVGDALLLDACADCKAIFHQRTNVFFNEALDAGEDLYFFHALRQSFGIDRVFNVPEPLVEVYPQPGNRVNTNGQGVYQAYEAVYRDFTPAFSQKAAQIFLARWQLQTAKFEPRGAIKMLKPALRLMRLRGLGEIRLILNALLFTVPAARRFLVT